MSTESLSQGNSQGLSEKAGAGDGDKDEAFERLYEAAHAAGRLNHLFDPSLDNSAGAFEKRFNAACDAGLFDDFLALYDAPKNSLPQGNSQAIPQNSGHAADVIAR